MVRIISFEKPEFRKLLPTYPYYSGALFNCMACSAIEFGLYQADVLSGEELVDFGIDNRGGYSQGTLNDVCKLRQNAAIPYPHTR